MFLNDMRKQFKDLSAKNMKLIVANHEKVEYFHNQNGWTKVKNKIAIGLNGVYRIPLQPDYFDWSLVDPKWKHLRRNSCGGVYLYSSKPCRSRSCRAWEIDASHQLVCVTGVLSEKAYKNNGMPWDEMILDRPEVA